MSWAHRLIRGWDEGWLDKPVTLGDRIGNLVLGAKAGQCFVEESTTVILFKLIHAALDARPGRPEIVADSGNFPADRFLLETIAASRGLRVRWIDPPADLGVRPEDVRELFSEDAALVLLSHVDYRSAYISDVSTITSLAHEHGALIICDLCHSSGVLPIELDNWGVDFAAGCNYKYLGGGPGSPAVGYVRSDLIGEVHQPISGWMGASNIFAMSDSYDPHPGVRRFISGTPVVLNMVTLESTLDMIEQDSIESVRAKSIALTDFAIELFHALLAPRGVCPRQPTQQGRSWRSHHRDPRKLRDGGPETLGPRHHSRFPAPQWPEAGVCSPVH